MSYKSGFYKGRLGIGLANSGGDGTGNPRFPLDVNGDIRLTGSLLRSDGTPYLGGGLINYIPKGIKSILNNDGSYYVGFGSHTPTEALDISGNLKVSGQILSVDGDNFSTVVPIAQQQTTTENPTWHGDVTTTVSSSSDSASGLALKANIASPTFTSNLKIEQTGTNNNTLIINANNHNNGIDIEVFQSDSTSTKKKLCLNPYGGNVGIGTTSPGSYKLYVNGTTYINGTITATSFSGNATTATTADKADKIKIQDSGDSTNTNYHITFGLNGYNDLYWDGNMYYNPYTNILTCPTFSGSLSGNASTANQVFVTHGPTTNSAHRINFTNTTGNGNAYIYGDSDFVFNPNTGNVGIGTTTPGEKLEIKEGSIKITQHSSNDTIHGILFSNSIYDRTFYMASETYGGTSNIHHLYIGYTTDTSITNSSYTNGSIITVRGDGNVGIGTTSPDYPLSVDGHIGITNNKMIIFHNSQGGVIQGNSASLYLKTAGVERLSVKISGNVGIGTTSPGSLLQVGTDDSSIVSDGTIRIAKSAGTSTRRWGHLGYDSGYNFGWGDQSSTDKQFKIAYGAPTNSLVIDSNGNVGIGTPSPACPLEVNGSVRGGYNTDVKSYFGRAWVGMDTYSDSAGFGHIDYTGSNYALMQNSSGNTFLNTKSGGNIYFRVGNGNQMTMNSNGNIGIGTTSPAYKLDIADDSFITSSPVSSEAKYIRFMASNTTDNTSGGIIWKTNYGSPYTKISASIEAVCEANFFRHALIFKTANGGNSANYTTATEERMRIDMDGNVGIGTTAPNYPLFVATSGGNPGSYSARFFDSAGAVRETNMNAATICIGCNNDMWASAYYASSDKRIKEDIEDVPDDLALEQLTNIPVRYYKYKDKLKRGDEKMIGFIAQEVKAVMPIAVSTERKIIPNEMRKLTDISWNDTILTTNLQDVSGVKYRFFVSNDPSGNDECEKEIIGNSDNTFTFEEKWNNVFCYGKEVDDFHILDKNKLFALNFSATQELDKKVITLEEENQELKTEVATLKSELAAIKAHLGI